MNVYVIYRFTNYETVKQHIDLIKKSVKNVTLFYFEPGYQHKLWHRRAKKKIKDSNMVVFFDSFGAGAEEHFKNIKWELKCAEKFRKRIVVFKENVNAIENYASQIYSTDYSDSIPNRFKYKIQPYERMISFLQEEAEWNVKQNLIKKVAREKQELTFEEKQLLLEQYKIMIDTSEKLMERRQATGNLYTTICSALIALIGASMGFGNMHVVAAVCFLSGIIIILLCCNWRSSLKAYELNNAGKFEVINQIELLLPAEMFECEYRYNTFNGIRSYSTRERMLPVVFMVFGGILILLAAVLLFLAPVLA